MATTRLHVERGDGAAPGAIGVRCPADGRVVGPVPDMTATEVHDVAAVLRSAQPAGDDLGPDGRAKHLLRLLDWVLDNDPHSPRSNRAQALLVRLTGAHDWRRRLGRKGRN